MLYKFPIIIIIILPLLFKGDLYWKHRLYMYRERYTDAVVTNACMHVHVHTCTDMHAYTHIRAHACASTQTHTHTHIAKVKWENVKNTQWKWTALKLMIKLKCTAIISVLVCPAVQLAFSPCVQTLFRRYLLKRSTFCNQKNLKEEWLLLC